MSLQDEITHLETRYSQSKNLDDLIELTNKYALNSQYTKAVNALKSFTTAHPNLNRKSKALIDLAYAKNYKFQGKVDEATRNYLKAKSGFVSIDDYKNYLQCGIEMIEFNRKCVKHQEAEQLFYYYLHFAKKKKIRDNEIWNGLYNRYAAIVNETNRPNLSIKYSRIALKYAEKLHDENLKAISYNEIGFSYKNLNQFDSCKVNYTKAFDSWIKKGYYRDGIHAKMNLITFLMHNQLISRNQEIIELKNLLKIINDYNVDYPKSIIFELIRSHYFFVGDYKTALFTDDSLNHFKAIESEKRDRLRMDEISEEFKNEELLSENKLRESELNSSREQTFMTTIVLVIVLVALFGLFFLWFKLRKAHKLVVKRNDQKTILIQEIHHRVKNNLQFVRSMLEMQTDSMESSEGVENIMDVTRRIDAMSLVHEMLYMEEDSMGVSVKGYLEQLIQLSAIAYSNDFPIRFLLSVEDMELPVDKVVSIGVICSELFTNSVKHAFTNNQDPTISVQLSKSNPNAYTLIVHDNGTEESEKNTSKRYSLGMRLIDIFSRQLNGKYIINRENGYEFRITFHLQ